MAISIKRVQNIGSYSKLLSMEKPFYFNKKQRVELVKQKIDSIYYDSVDTEAQEYSRISFFQTI
jgi:hypothetical protein